MGNSLKLACITIATNNYNSFIPDWYAGIMKNTKDDVTCHIFTDIPDKYEIPQNVMLYKIEHKPWPWITLGRYAMIAQIFERIHADVVMFVDVDLIFQKYFDTEELLQNHDLFGALHPGFHENPAAATYEDNEESRACVKYSEGMKYFQGCLWGGKLEEFKKMILTCEENVQKDIENNIVARWHDESHLNKYFSDKNVNVLHPGWIAPENWVHIKESFELRGLHLHKNKNEYPRFEGIRL